MIRFEPGLEEKLKKALSPAPVRKAANQIIISHVFLEQKIPNIVQEGRKAVVLSYSGHLTNINTGG